MIVKYIVASIVLLLCIIACNSDNEQIQDSNVTLKIGDRIYTQEDFDLYDSSTHILYFKKTHPEFNSLLPNTQFSFYADTIKIYEGIVRASYASMFPTQPYIESPSSFSNFLLKLNSPAPGYTDQRNDQRLINSFIRQGQLSQGLAITFNEVSVNGREVVISLDITNRSNETLLLLDNSKMGSNLFHYFTNGPVFLYREKSRYTYYYCNKIVESPSPYNMWSESWLSPLKSQASRNIKLSYSLPFNLPSGEYEVNFDFPGLTFQLKTSEELIKNEGRIWMGSVSASRKMTLN